jgi:SlyX protein
LNENIRRLEEKIAYLERHVTEQDKAMLEFAEQLAALRREVTALRDRARTGGPGDRVADADDLPHERPPHY